MIKFVLFIIKNPKQCSSTIDTVGSRAYCITDTAMENFADVVYTSREFNLSNRLFEDSPGFGEPQRIFVRSA